MTTPLCYSNESLTYGKIWLSWSNNLRDVYLVGFSDGIDVVYWKAALTWLAPGEIFKKPESGRVKKVRQDVFLVLDIATIRDVMTNLYKDPSNTYIPWKKMIYLARNKLMGKDISIELINARKEAHMLNEFLRDLANGKIK